MRPSPVRNSLHAALAAVVLVSQAAAGFAQPSSGQALLDFVRDAHRASRESIRTCACRLEFVGTLTSPRPDSTDQKCSGRFWCSPDAMRARYLEFGQDTDSLWKDSVRNVVLRTSAEGRQAVAATRSSYANLHAGRCDPWVRALLVLNIPTHGIENAPFEKLVSEAARWTKAERSLIGDKELIVIGLHFSGTKQIPNSWDVEVYFDPAVNYLVRKVIYVDEGSKGPFRREDEVLQFKECAPGLYFPEKIEGWSGTATNRDFHYVTVISDIRLNQPLPDDVFHFNFPNGVYLSDGIRGTNYRVGSKGNRISPEIPFGKIPPPPVGAVAQVVPGSETQEEPKPITRWILPLSVGILVLAAIAALVRRWRRSAAES
jgi:hypothetical protein